MRETAKLAIATLLMLVAVPSAALEPADWSWQDGLLGDSIDGDVFADDGTVYPGYLCSICREPGEYPVDYAAIAYNGFWGAEPWMRDSQLGIPFRIYNSLGRWVVVWFEDVLFDAPSLLPNTLDIRIRLPDGRIVTITVLQGGPDMPVGSDDSSGSTTSCGCGDGDEGDDEYMEPEEYEDPEIELTGTVEIIDPDDDGEFADWIEEL